MATLPPPLSPAQLYDQVVDKCVRLVEADHPLAEDCIERAVAVIPIGGAFQLQHLEYQRGADGSVVNAACHRIEGVPAEKDRARACAIAERLVREISQRRADTRIAQLELLLHRAPAPAASTPRIESAYAT